MADMAPIAPCPEHPEAKVQQKETVAEAVPMSIDTPCTTVTLGGTVNRYDAERTLSPALQWEVIVLQSN